MTQCPVNGSDTAQISRTRSQTLFSWSWDGSPPQGVPLLDFLGQSSALSAPEVIPGLKSRVVFKGSIKANKLLKIIGIPSVARQGIQPQEPGRGMKGCNKHLEMDI